MDAVIGTYERGQVKLNGPVNWPDGAAVSVSRGRSVIGISEEDWPRDPEGIARLLRGWETIEPLEFTAAEIADWEALRLESSSQSVED